MKRTHRKILWDRSGVSEVIGTILTLSITVVLFSSVIMMVDQFPAPGDNVYSDFQAKLEPRYNNTGEWIGAYIHITNTGGQRMEGLWTAIVVSIDSYTYNLDTNGTLDGVKYGLGRDVPGHKGVDNGDDDWDTGERWTFLRDNTTVGQDSNINVMILDANRNSLVWMANIQGQSNQFGPIISNIRADGDIRTMRSDPVDFGREFYVFAEVYDPDGDLDHSSVYMDLSSIDSNYTHINMTDPDGDGVFRGGPILGPDQVDIPIGYHVAIVRAQDLEGRSGTSSGRIAIGQDIGGLPNLVVREDGITLSNYLPTNGQTISITATVRNYGGWCKGNLSFYDVVGEQETYIDSVNFTISDAPDQLRKTISWEASSGGNHTIRVKALPIGASDAYLPDNVNETLITVMPTILLVDDDNHVNDLSPLDTVSYMRGALEACNFRYDLYKVGAQQNGPGYDYGDTSLVDYDVVIWMTGYEDRYTLTEDDQDNLAAYLNDDLGRGKGGSLWLIGQYIYDYDKNETFLGTYMKALNGSENPSPDGPTNPLQGVDGNPISDDWESNYIPIVTRMPGHNSSWKIAPDPSFLSAQVTFGDNTVPDKGDTINYENKALDSRRVFSPWEFSRIKNRADQAQVAYKTIKWLGNISVIFGNDLAISEQNLEPAHVFYNQNVIIDATIRNNGPDDLTTQAALMLDGIILTDKYKRNIIVPGMGGTTTISTNWTANVLGTHTLKWFVDPENWISETNEGNNQIPSYVSSGEVFVEFRILVVDDDDSPNNFNGTLANDTAYITDSLERLGYTYESPNGTDTTYIVAPTVDGPGIDILKDYSAIIWVTGNAIAGLTPQDAVNLENYVEDYQGRVWLIGNDVWSNVAASNLTGLMGLDNTTIMAGMDAGLSGTLRGVEDSDISHGMNYSIIGNPAVDSFKPVAEGQGVFYQNSTSYSAVAYENDHKGFTCGFNFSMLYGNDDDYINGDNATDELAYMVMRWFDKPEERNEVRITERDYFISDAHPQIGDAYVLRARVQNVGAEEASVLVRFMDGTTQIGSDSVSVSPGNFTSAEIIWRPLFAGQREITVMIDPVGEVPEVFEWFNNNISFSTYVYFFWDDMESGTAKWSHASTIININGESPLEYYNSNINVHTNISTEWDSSLTYGIVETSNTAHTYPNSYFMEEGTGMFGEANVLVSFAIDDSKSMTQRWMDTDPDVDSDGDGDPTNDEDQNWLDAAKNAAKILLNQLSDDSVCVSIWDFKGNNERRWAGPNENNSGRLQTDPANQQYDPANTTLNTYLHREPIRLGDTFISFINGSTIDGRQRIRDEIDEMVNPSGTTILWDAMGEAYLDNEWYTDDYPDLMPATIVLSDGADSQASDQASIADNRIEGGSDYWCPWDGLANGTQDYGDSSVGLHFGKYTFDWQNPETTTQWLEAGSHGGSMQYTNRLGLLHANHKIFTIGLGLEHHTNPWEPAITSYPGEVSDTFHAFYNPIDTAGSNYATNPENYRESGTLEYNLWRIANTTGAEYFHAPDADELNDIFQYLGVLLATGFNQTRASEPVTTNQGSWHDNSDKRAVTPEFNLTGMESAKLSFWHKYNILQGGNGAFLQVGYDDNHTVDSNGDGNTTNDWKWRYMMPPGQYTGMLYYQYDIFDDFDNRVQWCWNGVSADGAFGWEYANIDLVSYVPEAYRSNVKVAFNYTQFGGGTGIGWYIDDVRLEVSRSDSATTLGSRDVWDLTNVSAAYGWPAHSGHHAWSNIDPATGDIKTGVDNSLRTMPIDLTNARSAYLEAYFKFNINQDSGTPPDGFRVEISNDGGITWNSINQGHRAAYGISGTEEDVADGEDDWNSYTGLPESGNAADAVTYDYWVNASSLTRLGLDLSGWSGSQILIRFRVVTNNLGTGLYPHDNNHHIVPASDFGGFYVDDVVVRGETIFG